MSDGRGSYRKTVVTATLAAIGTLGIGSVAVITALHRTGASSVIVVLGWLLVALVALLVFLGAGFAFAGGMVALRRARLERLGIPYAVSGRREWVRGAAWKILSRILRPRTLLPGDEVVVRSADDVLATLDARGTLDGLPFMPEMLAWCGQRHRVLRRVEKVHDWVGKSGLHRMRDTVLLEGVRCTGDAHDGCQAGCHVLWKESWLRRASHTGAPTPRARPPVNPGPDLAALTRRDDGGAVSYVCQATQVIAASTPMSRRDVRHYVRDLLNGDVRPRLLFTSVALAVFNRVQRARGGSPSPSWGSAPHDVSRSSTPPLQLRAGDPVQIRSKADIERTLDARSRNRGLWFDGDMIRFCGGEHRVLTRVEKLIDERTGRMVRPATPCIVLEGVTATGEYLGLCPQNEYLFWRECWLARPDAAPAPAPRTNGSAG